MIDVIFGMIMIVGVSVLLWCTIDKGGGLSAITASLSSIDPKLTGIVGPPGAWSLFCLVFLTSVAPFGMPQLIQKFYAIKDRHAIRVGMIMSTSLAVLICGVAYFVGATTRIFLSPETTPNAFEAGRPLADKLMRNSTVVLQDGPYWILLGWAVGVFAAWLVVVRFGLTLSIAARARRFVVVCLVPVVLFTVLSCSIHFPKLSPPRQEILNVSPDGRYAIGAERGEWVTREGRTRAPVKLYIVDFSGGSVAPISAEFIAQKGPGQVWMLGSDGRTSDMYRRLESRHVYWTPRGMAYYVAPDYTTHPSDRYDMVTLRTDSTGNVQETRIPVGNLYREGSPFPSPDGRLAAIRLSDHPDSKTYWIEFVDIEGGRKLDVVIRELSTSESVRDLGNYWWQSNTEFGYIDRDGNRRIVRVVQ